MTDRFFTLTVLLELDTREDDAESIINAIQMIKGVQQVEGNISDMVNWAAEQRVKRELTKKLWDALSGEQE